METFTEERPDHEEMTTMASFIAGRAFYPMEWLEEDHKTLDPKLSALTSDMLLPTWPLAASESSNLKWGTYDNKSEGRIEVKTEARRQYPTKSPSQSSRP